MHFSLAAGAETEQTAGPGADGPAVNRRSFVSSHSHGIQTSSFRLLHYDDADLQQWEKTTKAAQLIVKKKKIDLKKVKKQTHF